MMRNDSELRDVITEIRSLLAVGREDEANQLKLQLPSFSIHGWASLYSTSREYIAEDGRKKPYPTWFNRRVTDQSINLNGLVNIDIDNLEDWMVPVLKKMMIVSGIFAVVFTTVSGKGLCGVVKYSRSKMEAEHLTFADVFRKLMDQMATWTFSGVGADTMTYCLGGSNPVNGKRFLDYSCCNPARRRFIAYDPELFVDTTGSCCFEW